MAANDAQERTEQATPKRIEDARRKGQVPRSRELVTLAMVAAAIGACAMFGSQTTDALALAMRGLEGLIINGGHMRLLVGCTLDEAEVDAIEKGESILADNLYVRRDPEGLLLPQRGLHVLRRVRGRLP